MSKNKSFYQMAEDERILTIAKEAVIEAAMEIPPDCRCPRPEGGDWLSPLREAIEKLIIAKLRVQQ